MVTTVPPEPGPELGETLVTVGTAELEMSADEAEEPDQGHCCRDAEHEERGPEGLGQLLHASPFDGDHVAAITMAAWCSVILLRVTHLSTGRMVTSQR